MSDQTFYNSRALTSATQCWHEKCTDRQILRFKNRKKFGQVVGFYKLIICSTTLYLQFLCSTTLYLQFYAFLVFLPDKKTFRGVVSAAVEQSRHKAIMVSQGDG